MGHDGKKDLRPQGSWEMTALLRQGWERCSQLAIEAARSGQAGNVLIDAKHLQLKAGESPVPFMFIKFTGVE